MRAAVRASAMVDLRRHAQGSERGRCIAQLVAALTRDPDAGVVAAAAEGLADAEAREAAPVVIALAREASTPHRREMALLVVGEVCGRQEPDVDALLQGALRDAEPRIRFQAVCAGSRLLADEGLRSVLPSALEDADASVRYVACRAVEARFVSESSAASAPGSRGEGVLCRLGSFHPRLVARLDDTDPSVVLAAALCLIATGWPAARQVVVDAVNGRRRIAEPEDEQAAIEACGRHGLHAAAAGLRRRLRGLSAPFDFAARVALARLGDESAAREIMRGLRSRSRWKMALSVAAAGMAGLQAARPELERLLQLPHRVDQAAVREALRGLDEAKTPLVASSSEY